MQTTSTILMIEPVSFGFNEQTADNNYFQNDDGRESADIQTNALMEFDEMVNVLCSCGVNVVVVQDTPEPPTPDSIFPNNWISFHQGGVVVIYPMYAANRREERRIEILNDIVAQGFEITDIIDFSASEIEQKFLEGTGSMVLDRVNRKAYATLSRRTDRDLLLQFCQKFGYKPVIFNATHSVQGKRLPVYHTNVLMSIGEEFAVVCLHAIGNTKERNALINSLTEDGKEIIEITEAQMHSFAGNLLQIHNDEGERMIVISESAYKSMSSRQQIQLQQHGRLLIFSIPTIEYYGGGGVRCMMAEVFMN